MPGVLVYVFGCCLGLLFAGGALYSLIRYHRRFSWALVIQLVVFSAMGLTVASASVREAVVHSVGSTTFPGAGRADDGKFYLSDGRRRTPVSEDTFRLLHFWETWTRRTLYLLGCGVPLALALYVVWFRRIPEIYYLLEDALRGRRLHDREPAAPVIASNERARCQENE
jgi:hypothetical protein